MEYFLGMKKILLIAALLFSFNSWAADDDLPPDGLFVSYHPNGQVRLTGKVTDRKKSGLWQYYYNNGQLQQKEKYRNGNPISTWKSFDNEGKLIAEYWYGNGIKDDTSRKESVIHRIGTIKVKPNKQ